MLLNGDATVDIDELARAPLNTLLSLAREACDEGHGRVQTWSPKVFIPLTQLCRNVCHYCTFAHPPRGGARAYLTPDEVLKIAKAGKAAGCSEALFTLGDKPERRFATAAAELKSLGHETTISYLAEVARLVRDETGLLPHINAGVMTEDDLRLLRPVSASMGLMLESVSVRLCHRGAPHFGSPDKAPAARLETMRLAGELAIPFTTGILIGIGETRAERVASLVAIKELNEKYGHIQETIVQNFRAKPGTAMARAPEPPLDDLLWTIAVARLIMGPAANIQAPPNLSPGNLNRLIAAGINDWGGVSPVTPDHVNPEAPWPEVEALREATESAGRNLVARLTIYPDYVVGSERWLDATMRGHVAAASDASGFARADVWSPGASRTPTLPPRSQNTAAGVIRALVARAETGATLDEDAIVALFEARGADFEFVCDRADQLRQIVRGDAVTYVVNRNINYTNICSYRCGFCAFSKGGGDASLRGPAYDLDLDEVARRAVEAEHRGATEVCMQGGIHPHYTGETYLNLVRVVRAAAPSMHIHAFSPLEIMHGARTMRLSTARFLEKLKDAGLDTLPGTAAEVLDDEVRAVICPDKLTTEEWLRVVEVAHRVGLPTTSTIMFGHVDTPRHWARHLIRTRDLQTKTGGFTEFVPLPFVHMEAPIARKGISRIGPTFRETVLMHAVARLALHPHLTSIQTSWVKVGPAGASMCLRAGANDLGGTLMNESISRAAGTQHGQEMPSMAMGHLASEIGRHVRQRTTLYGDVSECVRERGRSAPPLSPIVLTPPQKAGSFEREV